MEGSYCLIFQDTKWKQSGVVSEALSDSMFANLDKVPCTNLLGYKVGHACGCPSNNRGVFTIEINGTTLYCEYDITFLRNSHDCLHIPLQCPN